jgi:hypothetical protein
MNSNVGDSKPLIDNAGFDDADDMAETAVLNEPGRKDAEVVLDDEDAVFESTAVLDDPVASTDNVGDVSVEINVEELIADIEARDDKDAARKREIRRRLEEAVEDRAFEDTYAIDLDENAD